MEAEDGTDTAAAGRRRLLELRQKRAQQQQAMKFTTSQAHPRLEESARSLEQRAPEALGEKAKSLNHHSNALELAQQELAAVRVTLVKEEQKNAALVAQANGLCKEREEFLNMHGNQAQVAQQLISCQHKLGQAEETAATLKKSLQSLALERDAAIVAKDLSGQLRSCKKRLEEAEEEQFRTEEVTAALREELRAVVASQEEGSGAQRDLMDSANQIRRLERDLELTQREAEEVTAALQCEHQRAAEERERWGRLQEEKEELEEVLTQTRRRLKEALAVPAAVVPEPQPSPSLPVPQRVQAETAESHPEAGPPPNPNEPDAIPDPPPQLAAEDVSTQRLAEASLGADVALAVEGLDSLRAQLSELKEAERKWGEERARMGEQLRLALVKGEKGKQRLLAEVDGQSQEIERLFSENAGLAAGVQESIKIAVQWEMQLEEALKEGEELRRELTRLRSGVALNGEERGEGPAGEGDDNIEDEAQLKMELMSAKMKAESLSGRLAHVAMEHTKAVQCMNNMDKMYKPFFLGIESKLQQIKDLK